MPTTGAREKKFPKSVNMESLRRECALQRVLTKLELTMLSGNYYEAHQMYRTLYFRYLGQERYSELLDLMFFGAMDMIRHDQQSSAADLGILYVNVLMESGTKPASTEIQRIGALFSSISPSTPERETFIQVALRWSIKGTDYKTGHPELHSRLGRVYWEEKNYIMARQHFIHSTDGCGYATMLIELHAERGYTNEIDLFIAQAVLQYLCLQDKGTAQAVFDSYTSLHPKINNGPPYLFPLLNFLFFLLKTIDNGKLAVFTVLCEQYQICLNRDPCYQQYLDKIGQIFFNVPPPRPRNQGLLSSLLQSFINDLEYGESEEEQRNAASTSHAVQELD